MAQFYSYRDLVSKGVFDANDCQHDEVIFIELWIGFYFDIVGEFFIGNKDGSEGLRGEQRYGFTDPFLELMSEIGNLTILVHVLTAFLQQEVRGTLATDVGNFVIIVEGCHFLTGTTEREIFNHLAFVSRLSEVGPQLVYHLQYGTLSLVADLLELRLVTCDVNFRGGRCVGTSSRTQNSSCAFAHRMVVYLIGNLLLHEYLCDCHQILSKSSGLVSANVIGSPHSLTSLEIPDEVVLFLHLSDGVSQSNSDCKWESLRDSYHDYTDSDDEVFNDLV